MKKKDLPAIFNPQDRIIILRKQPVLVDADVAALYGVETRRINEAVKNNPDKFPEGYVFTLQSTEKQEVVENFDHLSKLKFSSADTRAFTEKGLYMLATILKSPVATAATLAIVETFTKVRELKQDLVAMQATTDKKERDKLKVRFGEILSDIMMPDLQTYETESTVELNFVIGNIKHTVKRRREPGKKDTVE